MRLNVSHIVVSALLTGLVCAGCTEGERGKRAPWESNEYAEDGDNGVFSLDDIISNGELIMLTLTGPDTYFDYHGRSMGTQFLLCEDYARAIGVALRVDVCKDTAEMIRRLGLGEGDVIVFQLPKNTGNVISCGFTVDSLATSWAVGQGSVALAASLNSWYKPALLDSIRAEETVRYSSRSIRRRVYSPMLDASSGIISEYDNLFKTYAPVAHWDWRLMAAQCYQESTFDPNALSWAGACGLMQIMPSTAELIGLPVSQIYDPEQNIAAAARYIVQIDKQFSDIDDRNERLLFVLASYNGGAFHIRDAMALAEKHGRNPHVWKDVAEEVLRLMKPEYYNDPVVKNGYMRGSETVDYVSSIRARWTEYRSKAAGGSTIFGGQDYTIPQKASKEHRFHF